MQVYQTPGWYNTRMTVKAHGRRLILEDGKPTGVILDLDEYAALLERLDEVDDLEAIRQMQAADWQTVSFDDYLAGRDDLSD